MLKRQMLGMAQIIRPLNVAISMVSIFLAVMICNPLTPWPDILLAVMVGGLVTAAANSINDYFDLEIDRINRPNRPLPAGLLSRQNARRISLGLSAIAMLCAAQLNPAALALTGFSIILLYFYSARLKRTYLWGNVVVSFSTGLAFIFGGAVAGDFRKALIPSLFAFLINGAREIVKDIEDIPGDKKLGSTTLPIRYGIRTAQLATIGLLCLLFLVTLCAFVFHEYGTYYFIAVMTMVNPLLLWVMITLWSGSDSASLRRSSSMLKIAMFTGLLAILLGQF